MRATVFWLTTLLLQQVASAQIITSTHLFNVETDSQSLCYPGKGVLDGNLYYFSVVESNSLKLYKTDSTGVLLDSLITGTNVKTTSDLHNQNGSFSIMYLNTTGVLGRLLFDANLSIINDTLYSHISCTKLYKSSVISNNRVYYSFRNSASNNDFYIIGVAPNNSIIHSTNTSVSGSYDHCILKSHTSNQIHAQFFIGSNNNVLCYNTSSGSIDWQYSQSGFGAKYRVTSDNSQHTFIGSYGIHWNNGVRSDTLVLHKLNQNGNVILTSKISDSLFASCIVEFSDMNYTSNDEILISLTKACGNTGTVLLQLDSSFNTICSIFIPHGYNNDLNRVEPISSFHSFSNGALVLSLKVDTYGQQQGNILLYEIDAGLQLADTLELNILPKNADDILSDLVLTPSGSLIMTGYTHHELSFVLDEQVQYFLATMRFGALSTNTNNPHHSSVYIYPNPSKNNVFIRLASKATANGQIEIFNINGSVVLSQVYPTGVELVKLDISLLSQGMYHIHLTNDHGQIIGSGLLIVN